MSIENLRSEMDEINKEMLALFIKRMEIGLAIGEIKLKDGKPIQDRKREEETLHQVVENSPENLQNYSLEFFRELMRLNRQFQEDYL